MSASMAAARDAGSPCCPPETVHALDSMASRATKPPAIQWIRLCMMFSVSGYWMDVEAGRSNCRWPQAPLAIAAAIAIASTSSVMVATGHYQDASSAGTTRLPAATVVC